MDKKLKFRMEKQQMNETLPFGKVWCLKIFSENEKPKIVYPNEISPKDFAVLTVKHDFYDFIQHLPKQYQNSPTYLSEIIEYAKKLDPFVYRNNTSCKELVEGLKSFNAVEEWRNRYSKSEFEVDLFVFVCGEKKKNPEFVKQIKEMPMIDVLKENIEPRSISDEEWNAHKPVYSQRDRK